MLVLAVSVPSWCLYLVATGGMAWEPFIALLPVGAYLVWRIGRGGTFRTAGFRREPGWIKLLLGSAAVAASYEGLWTAGSAAGGLLTAGLEPGGAPGGWLAAAALALLVGVGATALPEEFVYRGVLLRSVGDAHGMRAAVTASGILFAYAHLPNLMTHVPASPRVYVAVRMPLLAVYGSALAWATWRTRSIWLALGWHAGENLAGVLLDRILILEPEGPVWLVGRVGPHVDGVLAVVATAGVVWLVVGLARIGSGRGPPGAEGRGVDARAG